MYSYIGLYTSPMPTDLYYTYVLLYYSNTVQHAVCGAKYCQSLPDLSCTYIIVYCRLIFAQVYFHVVLSAASQYTSSRLSDYCDTLFSILAGDPIYHHTVCVSLSDMHL